MSKRALASWVNELVKYPQLLVNIPIHETTDRTQLHQNVTEILNEAIHVKSSSRFSGTEPMLRVLLSTDPGNEKSIKNLAQNLQALAPVGSQ